MPDLFPAKAGYPGMNLQIAATLDGALAAVGPVPVHGARHDAYAFAASGLAEVLTRRAARRRPWHSSLSRLAFPVSVGEHDSAPIPSVNYDICPIYPFLNNDQSFHCGDQVAMRKGS